MKIKENPAKDTLMKVIAALDNPEDCAAFFDDLCTIKEVEDMAQRLETAMLLKKGYNYQQINSEIGISTATISRVSKCLNYGTGGYDIAISKIEEK